jgi:hypothetical protein
VIPLLSKEFTCLHDSLSISESVHRLVFCKHKNIKTYVSLYQIPGKYSSPTTSTKCKNIPSFAHTFRAKIKQGRLKKGAHQLPTLKKNITMVDRFAWSSGMAMVLTANRSWQPLRNGLVKGADKGFYFIW